MKVRSSMDCVAALVANILHGFGLMEGTQMMTLDLKRASNSVMLCELIHWLAELEVPDRIFNFVNFLTTRRWLSFSAKDTSPSLCSDGVPQSGVLSPLLFNINLTQWSRHWAYPFLCPNVNCAFLPGPMSTFCRFLYFWRMLRSLASPNFNFNFNFKLLFSKSNSISTCYFYEK